MENLCRSVKQQMKGELALVMNRTLSTGHEHGFPVCGDLTSGRIVEGNASEVLIPACSDGSARGMIHSHRKSRVMQEQLGGSLMRKYVGYPSAQDMAPHRDVRFGCIVTEDQLTCFGKPTKPNGALKHLHEQETASNEAFRKWAKGELSDSDFRQVAKATVKEQERAMNASGGFCSVKL